MKIKDFKKIKAFTLIELLVVVAIIGILSAVGVIAYNGFTESAKISVSKSNYNNIFKILLLETQKCSIDGKLSIMSNPLNKNYYTVSCSKDKFVLYSDDLINHIENMGRIKNPYKIDGNRVQQPGFCIGAQEEGNIGFVWIRGDSASKTTTVCGCYKSPCNDSSNRFEKTINLDF
jgi:type IV pilus assembly protein PilA